VVGLVLSDCPDCFALPFGHERVARLRTTRITRVWAAVARAIASSTIVDAIDAIEIAAADRAAAAR
jgi:hypothetical protein